MSGKERQRKTAKGRKRGQKSAKERKRALPRKSYKQPGLKQPGLGTPKRGLSGYCQGESTHHHRSPPPHAVSEKKKTMVWKKKGNGIVDNTDLERRVYTREASDPGKEKGGFLWWLCIGCSEKVFQIRRFSSKFLGISFLTQKFEFCK